jgi:hypothetical protein
MLARFFTAQRGEVCCLNDSQSAAENVGKVLFFCCYLALAAIAGGSGGGGAPLSPSGVSPSMQVQS